MSKSVILDSSALIAEINLSDSLHERVRAINDVLSQTDRQVILPYEVFAEAINIFGKKVGRIEAARAGKALLARHVSESLRILPSVKPSLLLPWIGYRARREKTHLSSIVWLWPLLTITRHRRFLASMRRLLRTATTSQRYQTTNEQRNRSLLCEKP